METLANLSLAPLRYRGIFERDGGPIAGLIVQPPGSISGLPAWSAGAQLTPSLRPAWIQGQQLYDPVDGCGTHKFRSVACHIAISEALDRWAHVVESNSARRQLLGFDVDPSTTGIAAFPGLTAKAARGRANLEAIERWALVEWWLGNLSATLHEPEAYLVIAQPISECAVVVVWRTCSFGGLTFGFAAASSEHSALAHASIECARNAFVLEGFYRAHGSSDTASLNTLHNLYERRLVYFASNAGGQLFQRRVAASTSMERKPSRPRLLVDAELKGPWSRWATVWRVLYEQTAYDHLDATQNDFFFF